MITLTPNSKEAQTHSSLENVEIVKERKARKSFNKQTSTSMNKLSLIYTTPELVHTVKIYETVYVLAVLGQ